MAHRTAFSFIAPKSVQSSDIEFQDRSQKAGVPKSDRSQKAGVLMSNQQISNMCRKTETIRKPTL